MKISKAGLAVGALLGVIPSIIFYVQWMRYVGSPEYLRADPPPLQGFAELQAGVMFVFGAFAGAFFGVLVAMWIRDARSNSARARPVIDA